MAICGHNESAALHEQARVIAANQQVLCAINAQKIAVIERLREPTAIALAKGDNSRELATARFMQAWLAHREIELLTPKVLEKYKSQMPPPFESKVQPTDGLSGDFDIVPLHVKALLEESSSIEQQQRALAIARKLIEEQERDEHEALEEATADLVRLERYERRAWSRQKRAIRSFMNLKMIVDMKPVATSDRSSHEQSPT